MKKTITVAIPVYNGEKFILQALNSIVEQTIKADKILICDNCSNDNTINIINKFIENYPDYNITLSINKKNIGFQKNFRKCYDLANTDYLVILHVDDLLAKDALEKQAGFLNENPEYAVVGGSAQTIDSDGNKKYEVAETKDLLFERNKIYEFVELTGSYIPFSSVMYNLRLTRDIPYLEMESVGEDELYWPTLLKKHPIAILGDTLLYYREHEGQMHVSLTLSKFKEYKKHFTYLLDIAHLESDKNRRSKAQKVLKNHVSRMSINIGKSILDSKKNRSIALKYYVYGIKQNFKILFTKYFVKAVLAFFR